MNVLRSFPKLNTEKITAFYYYGDFSYVVENNNIRTLNKILSTIIFFMLEHSSAKISIKQLLDLTYKDKSWIKNKVEFENFFQNLYEQKFFVNFNNSHNSNIRTYDNSEEVWPIHISFEVTNKCNFKCFFCYNDFSKKENEMNLSEIESLLIKLREKGLLSIELTGGELFSRSDAFEIIDVINKNVNNFFILTNGYYLNKKNIEKLTKYKEKLSAIGISLHSHNKASFEKSTNVIGSFERVKNAIKLLKKNDFVVRIACPIINQDNDEIDNLCLYLKSLGVDFVQLGINMLPEHILSQQFYRKKQELNNFLGEMGTKYPELNLTAYEFGEDSESVINLTGCGAFSKNLVLTPSGLIKPCAYFSEDSVFTLEKIEEHTLSSKKMYLIKQFITGNYLVDKKKVNDICKECDSYRICSHCFYVRNLLNKDKSRCLLVNKYHFQFEKELKDLI